MKKFTNILIIIVVLISIKCVNTQSNFTYFIKTGVDLIIQDVEYEVKYLDGHDQTGMPVQNRFKDWKLNVKIINIGKEDCTGPLYLAYTFTNDDARLHLFTKFKLIKPLPTLIEANTSIEMSLNIHVERNLSEMRFKINEPPNFDDIQKESDYFNNTYTINFK